MTWIRALSSPVLPFGSSAALCVVCGRRTGRKSSADPREQGGQHVCDNVTKLGSRRDRRAASVARRNRKHGGRVGERPAAQKAGSRTVLVPRRSRLSYR